MSRPANRPSHLRRTTAACPLLLGSVLALCAAAPAARAQVSGPLAPGARVRVTAPALAARHGPFTAVAADPDTLVLQGGARGPIAVPLASVTRLDVSAGRHSRARLAGRGALVGLLAGAALTGTAYLYERGRPCSSSSGGECAQYLGTAVAGIVLTPALTAGGAIVGALWSPGERWERLVPPTRAGVPPGGAGRALSAAVRF